MKHALTKSHRINSDIPDMGHDCSQIKLTHNFFLQTLFFLSFIVHSAEAKMYIEEKIYSFLKIDWNGKPKIME